MSLDDDARLEIYDGFAVYFDISGSAGPVDNMK
jgi:hypothetical protein